MLAFAAQAYVYFPGGFGTMDEFTELVTLIQTKKISVKIPMVLVGREFWTPFLDWVKKAMVEEYKTVTAEELNIFTLVDTAEEAMQIIKDSPPRFEFG
jgi:predicted Rossmann-fold nucleotide-binding protein